jgi:amidase
VNAHTGTPRNPHAPERIPGGSSSGSAVATAGGLVDFALGTDTAGSVRVPASLCGVFGIRPTQGRISLEGVVPFARSFDTVGWFAREAELLRRVGEVLLGDGGLSSPASHSLFIADDAFALTDEEIRDALGPALEAAARVTGPPRNVVISLEGLDRWVAIFNTLRGAEVREALGEWIDRVQPAFGPGIRERFEQAKTITADAVEKAGEERARIQKHLDTLLAGEAVLCLPTVPVRAPLRSSTEKELAVYRARTLPLTTIATIGGLPQVTLPVGETEGCPVGLSLISARDSDLRLLRLAEAMARIRR